MAAPKKIAAAIGMIVAVGALAVVVVYYVLGRDAGRSRRVYSPLVAYPICDADGKWGCMDHSRTLVVDFTYDNDNVVVVSDKYVVGKRDGVYVLSTLEGEVLAECSKGIWDVARGLVALFEPGGCEIMSIDGQRRLGKYSFAWPGGDEGLVAVMNAQGKWGFIDESGKVKIPFRFDGAGGFYEGRCAVTLNGLGGYIDRTGSWVVDPRFSQAGIFEEGYAAVANGGPWWYIDRDGKNPFGRTYRICTNFSEGLAATMDESGRFGYLDSTGRFAIRPEFKYAAGFSEGLASVGIADSKGGVRQGYIDSRGELLIEWKGPPRPFRGRRWRSALSTELGPFRSGWARVEFAGGSGYIDTKGKWVWVDGDPRWLARLGRRQTQ